MDKINLKDYTKEDLVFGNALGREVYQKLYDYISSIPNEDIFEISLEGIRATDASFPRESVINLAKNYKGEKAFFITNAMNDDILDNWAYGSRAKKLPLISWKNNTYKIIGEELTDNMRALLDFIMENNRVTSSAVSKKFDISTQNANAKLKKLLELGLVLASKEPSETGGLEYIFKAIKKSEKTG